MLNSRLVLAMNKSSCPGRAPNTTSYNYSLTNNNMTLNVVVNDVTITYGKEDDSVSADDPKEGETFVFGCNDSNGTFTQNTDFSL